MALKGVNLDVEKGEIVTIIGANGAGKSTLLKTISGLIRPRNGDVTFNDKSLHRLKPHEVVRLGIVQIQEGRAVLKRLTVQENLELGAYLRRDSHEVRKDMLEVYRRFPRIEERKNRLAATLSGGEQQMLAIGRALMARPTLLMMDEPSLGLAPLIVREIFSIVGRLKQEGMTILLVEQNAKKALQLADRGYVLEVGNVVLEGKGSTLLNSSQVQEAYLGG